MRLFLWFSNTVWSWTSLPIGKFYGVFTFSPCHGRQVPYITDNCPRSHHQVNVGCHTVLWGVPEGVAKDWVVLDGHWVNGTAHLEAAFLKLHHRRVVDASAFGENQNRQLGGVVHMLFQPRKGCNRNGIQKYKNLIFYRFDSKSQFFVQKFNFNKIPTFSRVFHQKTFWRFLSWNQSCQQLKSPKPQHFHEFFTQKIDNFHGKSKLNFWTKNEDFE